MKEGLDMKRATIVPALLIVVAGLLSSSIAEASCENICVRMLRACLASEWPADDCWAEHVECLNACNGGDISGKLALKDEDPQSRVASRGAAQSCVIERGESAAPRALLALLPGPRERTDVRASQAR